MSTDEIAKGIVGLFVLCMMFLLVVGFAAIIFKLWTWALTCPAA